MIIWGNGCPRNAQIAPYDYWGGGGVTGVPKMPTLLQTKSNPTGNKLNMSPLWHTMIVVQLKNTLKNLSNSFYNLQRNSYRRFSTITYVSSSAFMNQSASL